jgi:TM2 domain-containing membrane protein YozV
MSIEPSIIEPNHAKPHQEARVTQTSDSTQIAVRSHIELGYEQFGQHSFTTKGKFMSTFSTPPSANIESKRVVCGVLAIVLSGLGIHRFILGDVVGGILRILITLATCGFGSLIGLIEGIIYLTKSDADFIAIYQIGKKSWF